MAGKTAVGETGPSATTGLEAGQILDRLQDPVGLETLFRDSPRGFGAALAEALVQRPDSIVLRVWAARLAPREQGARAGLTLGQAVVIALAAGLLVRVPAVWLGIEWYYPRFAPSIVILALAACFWLQGRDRRLLLVGLVLALVTGGLASMLPGEGDSVVMALVHLPVLWWVFLGVAFTSPGWRQPEPRIRFLRYNGELLILGSLVALGGMVFSGLTVALFELVSKNAARWYIENLAVIGAAAVPVGATYLYDAVFRRHTGIASVLARVFAPLFLVMTGTYLVVAFLAGQNPFADRNFLITMNGLLLVVLGMTVLSVAERGDDQAVGWGDYVNLALLGVTLMIDAVAVSAILFRLTAYGLTPNRVVVLGANIVILVHLVLVSQAYLRFAGGRIEMGGVRRSVARYLPVYAGWAALVAFVLPFLFRFS